MSPPIDIPFSILRRRLFLYLIFFSRKYKLLTFSKYNTSTVTSPSPYNPTNQQKQLISLYFIIQAI